MDQPSPSEELWSEHDDGGPGAQHGGQRLFPSDELLAFHQQLAMLRASNHTVQTLVGCVEAARSIVGSESSLRQTEMDAVRRFLRDDLQLSADKVLAMGTNSRVYADEADVLESLYQIVHLAAGLLKYRQRQSAAVLAELDVDLQPLMTVMLMVLSQHKPLYQRVRYSLLPDDFLEKRQQQQECLGHTLWVQPQINTTNAQLQDDDRMQEDEEEEHMWYTYLCNTFGQADGFSVMVQMLTSPATVNFELLNTTAAVLAQVSEEISFEAKEQFAKVIDPLIAHTMELVSADSDRLSNHGCDRTYSNFHNLVTINLPRLITYVVANEEDLQEEAVALYQKLRVIMCTFVSKMLESSSFNKLLSGAKNCYKVLQLSVGKYRQQGYEPEVVYGWIQENQIVERLLRTGLHHKQYMEQVKGVMAYLTKGLQLTEEHLDLMWAVTEKEDAYDAVKTNMFELLAEVAAVCQPSQLDMLFAKLVRSQARSVQDTERLLTLLENLAHGDAEDKMRDKIIQLVWDLTMAADAPPELADLHTMETVVKHYVSYVSGNNISQVEDQHYCFSLISRCFKELQAGRGGQVPLLRTARDLLKLLPMEVKAKGACDRGVAIDVLQKKQNVLNHLVETVCNLVSQLRQKIAAGTQAAACESSSSGGAATDAATIQAEALAELGQGSWTYTEILREYILTLKLLASFEIEYFPEDLAGQLWDALMNAPTKDHMTAALAFFRGGYIETPNSTAYFDDKTQRQLLEQHLVQQDVSEMSLAAAKLTWDIFAIVNSSVGGISKNPCPKKLNHFADDLEKVIGLDLVWRIYMGSPEERVADLLRERLLTMYYCGRGYPTKNCHVYRNALVTTLVRHMRDVAADLSAPAQDTAASAARTVARCLGLAKQAVDQTELNTMPPVPAHNRAWRGTPVTLEVQRDGATRLRVTSHDNEYIGLLRERLASHMGCSAKNVRMFTMGQELQQDSQTVQSSGLRNRQTLNAMESPEPNRFTKAPSEYRPHFELNAITWILSQTEGLYPLLLQFIDAASGSQGIASMALELLAALPTHSALSERLAAALDGPDKQQQLASVLTTSGSSGTAVDKQCAPYQMLYGLQALCALLFPTFDEVLLASADRDAAAEGSACPSPAATAPAAPPAQGQPGAAEAPAPHTAADAAAVSAVQHQHHREVQQQEFLHSRGLEVVLDAARKAAMCSSTDLHVRRQLSELLVVLIHNLLDAAQGWQAVPWATAAAAGHSNGPSAMSGAESGAGQPAGVARLAAPASSLVGANGAAVESASMPLADAQPGAEHAVSSAMDGDSPDGAGPSSKAAATTSDTACHHPPSPAMEVSSPLPGQQQQPTLSKQRQRGADLPPLLQQAAANGGSGAAAGPSLAALFSSATLSLMADTLLSVAVDTSQLWGSDAASAAVLDDDSSRDVAVAREALQLLQRLLEQHPPLIQPLLLEAEQPLLVTRVLLSPYYGALRRQAGELLERLASIDSNRPQLLPWLLSCLADARPLAQQQPGSCAEFYELLSAMLTKLGHSWGMLPEQLFATANAMLDEEVAALQAMAAAGPSQGPLSPNTKQQQRRRRGRRQQPVLRVAEDSDAADAADEQQEPMCALLQGRLQLVLALVRVLDRRGVGSQGQGGLMRLLLQEFLFPEAVAKGEAAAGQLNLARCANSLEPHCATPSSRRAALELLAELMGDTPASLEEGVSMLLHLHYQQQVLQRFGLSPRPLRAPGQYAGLKNGGATCYMNAVFQQLFMQPGIRAGILGSAEVPEVEKEDSVFAQLQALFAQLALSKSTFAHPRAFWQAFKDYDGTPTDVQEHQDAYEFFTRLQDCIDQHLISTSQQPAIKPVMGGTFVQQIICRGHNFTSERNEDFYQISVEVKGMGSLEKSLEDYVKGELMEGDNAYLCEELGKRVPAVKRTAIRTLPQMLCVHLKRFEFDYHNQTRHKLRDRFEFPLELDMFPYTAEGLAAADAQQKAAEDQQGQGRPVRTSSGSGAAGQPAQGSNPAYMYDLHGVVVHSGSAFTGHYYSYIKERPGSNSSSASSRSSSKCGPEQGSRWYCFDDKDVSPWSEDLLETACFGGKASQDYLSRHLRAPRNEYERAHSAYMLFYERRPAEAAASGSAAGIKQEGAAAAATGMKQEGAADGAGSDVDMVAADASQGMQPADAAAAAAALGLQQRQLKRLGSFSVPYGMPESLFRSVTEENISLIWQLHVLDKHYFRFVRQLVDSRGDLGQLTTRKSRRRDAAAAGAAPGPRPLAAVPSGSSDRVHSSMVCDPSTQPQQQAQPCPSSGSGALPMQVSPSPTPAASAPHAEAPTATAAAAAGPPMLDVLGSGLQPGGFGTDLQQSPGPSSRRGEEAEAVSQALLRLGVLFQFKVYLYANDSLRSESNVWTEALKSLMGSGSSSTICMQTFLELVQANPNFLQMFLVNYPYDTRPTPRTWASDMLCWAIRASSKRCAHQLQAYVSACLRQRLMLVPEAAASSQNPAAHQQQQQQHQAERGLRQQLLPPLCLALVGVVEQLVVQLRGCLPHHPSGNMYPTVDVPSELATVLLAYAESSPWAAAHLLQVFNVVPDLADLIHHIMNDPNPDDTAMEELAPLVSLLDELVSYASNLPQLARDGTNSPVYHNPYLKQLQGSGGSPSSSGSNAAAEAAANGVSAILPAAAFRKLMNGELLQQLPSPELMLKCPRAVHLCVLLTWNNSPAIFSLVTEAANALGRELVRVPLSDTGLSESEWETVCLGLSQIMLQADQYAAHRVMYWGAGYWGNFQQQFSMRNPGVFAYPEPVSPMSLGTYKLLGLLYRHLDAHPTLHGFGDSRQSRHNVLLLLGRFVFAHWQRLNADLTSLLDFGRNRNSTVTIMLDQVQEHMVSLLRLGHDFSQRVAAVALLQQQQQQQQQAPQQQVQQMEEGDDDEDGQEEGEAEDEAAD